MTKLNAHQVLDSFILEKIQVLEEGDQAIKKLNHTSPDWLHINYHRKTQHLFFEMLRRLDEALLLSRILVNSFPTTEQINKGKTARFDTIKHEYGMVELQLFASVRNCFAVMIKGEGDGESTFFDSYSEVMKRLLDAEGGVHAVKCLDWVVTAVCEEMAFSSAISSGNG